MQEKLSIILIFIKNIISNMNKNKIYILKRLKFNKKKLEKKIKRVVEL